MRAVLCQSDNQSFIRTTSYIAYTPCNCAFFARRRCLICLTFDTLFMSVSQFNVHAAHLTKVHDVISADGTVVNDNVPGP